MFPSRKDKNSKKFLSQKERTINLLFTNNPIQTKLLPFTSLTGNPHPQTVKLVDSLFSFLNIQIFNIGSPDPDRPPGLPDSFDKEGIMLFVFDVL